MTLVNHPELAAFYSAPSCNTFPGYAPENSFDSGLEVVVGRVPATVDHGYNCVITESQYPARFFEALCENEDGDHLRLNTGSGDKAGALLHALCQMLASGRASFEEPATISVWRMKKRFRPQPDGHAYRTRLWRRHLRLDAEERLDGLGGRIEAFSLYFDDLDLALRVAQSLSEGMLGLEFK